MKLFIITEKILAIFFTFLMFKDGYYLGLGISLLITLFLYLYIWKIKGKRT